MTKQNRYDREIIEMLAKASLPICTCIWYEMKHKSIVSGYRSMAKSLIRLEDKLYVSNPPMIELEEFVKAMKEKEKEIARLKKYMEENDPLSLYKLWLNETIKEMVIKPLVKDLIDKKMVKA